MGKDKPNWTNNYAVFIV